VLDLTGLSVQVIAALLVPALSIAVVSFTDVMITSRAFAGDAMPNASSEMRALADLPSKEALRAQLVGALQGPMSQLVTLLTAPQSELVRVLEARSKGSDNTESKGSDNTESKGSDNSENQQEAI
jgi:hypothetical protein